MKTEHGDRRYLLVWRHGFPVLKVGSVVVETEEYTGRGPNRGRKMLREVRYVRWVNGDWPGCDRDESDGGWPSKLEAMQSAVRRLMKEAGYTTPIFIGRMPDRPTDLPTLLQRLGRLNRLATQLVARKLLAPDWYAR